MKIDYSTSSAQEDSLAVAKSVSSTAEAPEKSTTRDSHAPWSIQTATPYLGHSLGWTSGSLSNVGAAEFSDLYRSDMVLNTERQRLFNSTWALVADSSQLQDPGNYITVEVGNCPAVVLRGEDNEIRAFHNVCRHRGITLLSGCGITGRHLTCPYHQWSYRLDGSLATIPQRSQQFPDIDSADWGLLPIQCEVWHGMVFVNPSLEAPSLSGAMSGLDAKLDAFLSGPLVQIAQLELEARCNWKFLIENHVDVYHLWYLHSQSLQDYDHKSFVWENMEDNWWSLEPLKDPSQVTDSLPWISQREREGIGAHLLFPNLMLVTTSSYFATYDAVPIAPDRTKITLRIRSIDGADPEALLSSVKSFMEEDLKACEALQAASGSPAFIIGPLASSHEKPILSFHSSLRKALNA